jgi:hypothetical protein
MFPNHIIIPLIGTNALETVESSLAVVTAPEAI